MNGSFWLGLGAGAVLTGAAIFAFHAMSPAGDGDLRPLKKSDASGNLQERLAAAERDLEQARADAARERTEARALTDALTAKLNALSRQPAVPPPDSRPDAPGALGGVASAHRLLEQGDFKSAAVALTTAFGDGIVTKLELMQIAAQFPDLIVAGVNDYGLPDAFRSVLIDTLSSLKDPLLSIGQLNLDQEPNQRFSARIAAVVAQVTERSAAPDARAVTTIQKLLAGNQMLGEKVNLYPVLAQLGALGDQAALAMLREANVGIYTPGIKTMLNPPARDELGNDLTGAIIYSIQYNKGQWGQRPIQLQGGDTIVSIGGDRVASASDFFNVLKKHHNLGPNDFVDAGVFRANSQQSGRYEYATLRLDPGDLQLMYGVYSVKRR